MIGDTTDNVIQLLNVLPADVCLWCELNRLTVHTKKYEPMIISRTEFIDPLQQVRCGNLVINLFGIQLSRHQGVSPLTNHLANKH